VRRDRSPAFRRRYGARPLHLAGHLVALAIAAFAFDRIFSGGGVPKLLALYLGLVVAHDLIFVPLYSWIDGLMRRSLARLSSSREGAIPIINHVRAPLLISALLLLIYSPLIFGLSDSYYFDLSGHHLRHYLSNWLLITAALLLGSGLIYAARVFRRARQAH
jgi:hypothetical protein